MGAAASSMVQLARRPEHQPAAVTVGQWCSKRLGYQLWRSNDSAGSTASGFRIYLDDGRQLIAKVISRISGRPSRPALSSRGFRDIGQDCLFRSLRRPSNTRPCELKAHLMAYPLPAWRWSRVPRTMMMAPTAPASR